MSDARLFCFNKKVKIVIVEIFLINMTLLWNTTFVTYSREGRHRKKERKNMLPRVHLIGVWGVKLFSPKYCFKFCQNLISQKLIFFSFVVIFSCVLTQFKFLSFVAIWVVIIWVLTFVAWCLSFVIIWVLSFVARWALSFVTRKALSFVPIWIFELIHSFSFEFGNNLSF